VSRFPPPRSRLSGGDASEVIAILGEFLQTALGGDGWSVRVDYATQVTEGQTTSAASAATAVYQVQLGDDAAAGDVASGTQASVSQLVTRLLASGSFPPTATYAVSVSDGGIAGDGHQHLLRYCARPPFALERLSVIRGPDGRITRIRYVLPRHKAANWVGRGRGRKSTRPGANGVVELAPLEFLDRLADLVPPPRKHRHRYHGVFAPNHKLRKAVTAMAIGNIGKRCDAATGGPAAGGQPTEGCCDANQKPRSHDTSRIAWAKLMARVGEEFPLECPNCRGDIRLITLHPSRGRSGRSSPT